MPELVKSSVWSPVGTRLALGTTVWPRSAKKSRKRWRISAAGMAPLVDKMRAAKLTGERKPVTALFADVVGSTTLAEQMDPEDWTQLINEAFDLMSQAVFRYEGTIAQLQGDAMLAFFGAPVAHEDDPDRAVMAALDMVAVDRRVRAPAEGPSRASTSASGRASTPGRWSWATWAATCATSTPRWAMR
jgi:class 3 adenylate cyclase